MKFSDSSAASGPPVVTADLQVQLVGVAQDLLAGPVLIGSMDAGIDLVRAIGQTERALEAVRLQVSRQIDNMGVDGQSLSAEDVLTTAGKMSDGNAKRAARRAHLALSLPKLGEAGDTGRVSPENLDAVSFTRWKLRYNPDSQAAFDARDAVICAEARRRKNGSFRRWLRDLTVELLAEDDTSDLEAERARNRFRVGKTPSGRFRGSFDLDTLSGEQLRNLVRATARSLANQKTSAGEEVHYGENLDAEAFLKIMGGGAAAGRPLFNAVVDLETLTTGPHPGTVKRTDSGTDLPVSLIRRYLCDAWIRHVGLDANGVPLAVGRAYRTATEAQRSALAVIYETCACCDTPFPDCEIHHIIPWESHGLTELANLIPLCSTHHHKVHEGRWTIHLQPDRTLRLYTPDNELWQTYPLPSKTLIQIRRRSHRRKQLASNGGELPGQRRQAHK